MSELCLKQSEFTDSACGSFTKHCERIQKFKETGNLNNIYENELHKACFAHDVAYFDEKDLAKRTFSDKTPKEELVKLLEIGKMMNIKEDEEVCSISFLIKKERDRE